MTFFLYFRLRSPRLHLSRNNHQDDLTFFFSLSSLWWLPHLKFICPLIYSNKSFGPSDYSVQITSYCFEKEEKWISPGRGEMPTIGGVFRLMIHRSIHEIGDLFVRIVFLSCFCRTLHPGSLQLHSILSFIQWNRPANALLPFTFSHSSPSSSSSSFSSVAVLHLVSDTACFRSKMKRIEDMNEKSASFNKLTIQLQKCDKQESAEPETSEGKRAEQIDQIRPYEQGMNSCPSINQQDW